MSRVNLQERTKIVLALSIIAMILGLTNIPVISTEMALILLFLASLLLSDHFVQFFKTERITALILSCAGLLIITSVILGILGWLRLMEMIFTFEAVILLLIFSDRRDHKFHLNFPSKDILVVTAIGLTIATTLRYFSPYPIQIDTDIPKEAIRIAYIAKTGYAPFLLPSDFRPITFDTLLASVSILTSTPAYDILWYGVFLTYPLFGIGVVLVAEKISSNGIIATISGLFALLVCGFWYFEGPSHVLPITISIILTLFILRLFLDWDEKGWTRFFSFISLLIFYNLGYYYMVIAILPLFSFFQVWPTRRLGKISSIVAITGSVGLFYAALFTYSSTIGLAEPATNDQFVAQALLAAYSPMILLLFGIGIFAIIQRKNRSTYPLLFFSLLVLATLLIPIQFGSRLEPIARPELAIVSTIGLIEILSFLKMGGEKKLIGFMCSLLLITSPILISPYQSWFTSTIPVPDWHGLPIRIMSQDEGTAGLWLRDNGNGFIVSDIESSVIMQGISGLGGMLNPMLFLSNYTLANLIYSALHAQNINETIVYLREISCSCSVFYFVITSRTQPSVDEWLSYSQSELEYHFPQAQLTVYYPTSLTPFSDPSLEKMKLVFLNHSVAIYEVSIK
jgi:hypothetical protein